MSAYICDPSHIGILAAYAAHERCVIREFEVMGEPVLIAQTVARNLARENIRSVAHRYPNDTDGNRPGPCLKDAEIEEAAAIYAAHFLARPQRLPAVQILKLVNCLMYQSCETPDWDDTVACKQLDWIVSHAIRQLPGYEDAMWSFERPIPEIEALYERNLSV